MVYNKYTHYPKSGGSVVLSQVADKALGWTPVTTGTITSSAKSYAEITVETAPTSTNKNAITL